MSSQPPSGSFALQPSTDGYIRMNFETLTGLNFVTRRCWEDPSLLGDLHDEGITTDCAGYCEWATASTPCISIGWAWFDGSDGTRTIAPGGISSNVMLVAQKGAYDLGPNKTEVLLQAWLSEEGWHPQGQTPKFIAAPSMLS
jgi:hypothetical protein